MDQCDHPLCQHERQHLGGSRSGLEDSTTALLVMIGGTHQWPKVVLAVESGQRESKESWGTVRRDLHHRGLKPWRCMIADGHLASGRP